MNFDEFDKQDFSHDWDTENDYGCEHILHPEIPCDCQIKDIKDFISSHYRPIETSLDKEEVKKAIEKGMYSKDLLNEAKQMPEIWEMMTNKNRIYSDLLTTLGLENK